MSTIVFPDISAPAYPLKETKEDAVIRSKMEDGTVKQRPRYTRIRKTFEVNWKLLKKEEKTILENFHDVELANGALAFEWTHPLDGTVHYVHFDQPPSFTLSMTNRWECTCKWSEV